MGDLSTGPAGSSHPFSGGARSRVLLLGFVLALGAASRPASGEDPAPAARWTGLGREAVEKLHGLADWCTAAKLFRSRAETYEAVLRFDADDARARRWLRYRRGPDGGWERPPGYSTPTDRGRGRDRYEERRAAWRAWFAAEATALIAAAGEAEDKPLAARILRLAAALAPDDEGLRLAHGEVRHEQDGTARWILLESRTALARRRAIRHAARMAVAKAARPKDGPRTTAEETAGVAWGPVLQGEHVRVLGAPKPEEMRKQYAFCESTWPFFQAVFGLRVPPWNDKLRYGRGVTIYVLDSLEAGNAFLAKQPGMTERTLGFVAPLVGTWLPDRVACVVKAPMPEGRLEAGPKLLLAAMCRELLGITADRAWASEGLGHYLVYPLVGTRMIGTVRDLEGRYAKPRPGVPEYDRHTPLQDDWLRSGLALLESAERPDLHLMVGKDVNTITQDEVLYGYCVVAYLIEGRPDECVAFFQAVGRSKQVDLDAVALEHLGTDLPGLEARVLRWLRETAELAAER